MIQGKICNNDAIIPLTIAWDKKVTIIDVVIDTGYQGEVILRHEHFINLNLSVPVTKRLSMGNGKQSSAPTGSILANLDGITLEMQFTLIGYRDMVGMKFLKKFGYILEIDFLKETVILRK